MAKFLKSEFAEGAPPVCQGICDVRDVADAHIAGMENDAAVGMRFLISSPRALRQRYLADVMRGSPTIKQLDIALPTATGPGNANMCIRYNSERVRDLLGLQQIDTQTTVLDMATKMVELHGYGQKVDL